MDKLGKNKMNTYYALRNAIFVTFRGQILESAFYFTLGECLAVGFTSFLVFFIKFLKDPDAPLSQGILYLIIFSMMMTTSVILRNLGFFTGYCQSISMRKTIISALF